MHEALLSFDAIVTSKKEKKNQHRQTETYIFSLSADENNKTQNFSYAKEEEEKKHAKM